MNTSKEAAKQKGQKVDTTEDDDFLNPEGLTPAEIEAMEKQAPAVIEKEKANGLAIAAENLSDDAFINSMFENMEAKKSHEAFELTSNYIDFSEFAEGEERNYIFTGFDTFTDDKGEVRPAVKLMDKSRKMWICASIVTVRSLQKVKKVPCPVRIKVNGKVKGKNGSYFDTNVFVL